MKIYILLAIFMFQSCGSLKQSAAERDRELILKQKPSEDLSARDLNKYPDYYLTENSALQDLDTSTGILLDSYYTGNDSSRVSVSLNYSQDYEDPTKVQTVDLQYLSHISSDYRKFWWGFQMKRTTAKYSAIAEESTSDSLVAKRGDNIQSFTVFGLGVGHRFRALSSEFLTDRFFENVNIFANYLFHSDGSNDEKYNGYGYTAEYGINYRSSRKLFYGGKLSYNWAMVERTAQAEEKLPERSLVFGWLTFGFELGFYF